MVTTEELARGLQQAEEARVNAILRTGAREVALREAAKALAGTVLESRGCFCLKGYRCSYHLAEDILALTADPEAAGNAVLAELEALDEIEALAPECAVLFIVDKALGRAALAEPTLGDGR